MIFNFKFLIRLGISQRNIGQVFGSISKAETPWIDVVFEDIFEPREGGIKKSLLGSGTRIETCVLRATMRILKDSPSGFLGNIKNGNFKAQLTSKSPLWKCLSASTKNACTNGELGNVEAPKSVKSARTNAEMTLSASNQNACTNGELGKIKNDKSVKSC